MSLEEIGILIMWGIFSSIIAIVVWKVLGGLEELGKEAYKKRTIQKQIYEDEFLCIRTEVLKRDNYRCVNCGMTGKELHVHHVVPRSEGGTNDLSNLVTLCSRCHSVQDAKGHYLIQANKQEDEIEEDTAFGMPIDMLEEDR